MHKSSKNQLKRILSFFETSTSSEPHFYTHCCVEDFTSIKQQLIEQGFEIDYAGEYEFCGDQLVDFWVRRIEKKCKQR